MSKEILLDVRHLTQQFHLTKKIKVKAVDDVSFQIHKGEIFGLVGESGSGKSTVARCLMNIYQPAQGEIWYKDVNICDKKEFKKHKKMLQTCRQMIFQDSASSLNQKMKVSDIITEPMRIQHITPPRGSFVKEAAFQMEYLYFSQDSLCLAFPQGALPSQEYTYLVSVAFNDECKALLHPWAVPNHSN